MNHSNRQERKHVCQCMTGDSDLRLSYLLIDPESSNMPEYSGRKDSGNPKSGDTLINFFTRYVQCR
jgi:hypothetical protein